MNVCTGNTLDVDQLMVILGLSSKRDPLDRYWNITVTRPDGLEVKLHVTDKGIEDVSLSNDVLTSMHELQVKRVIRSVLHITPPFNKMLMEEFNAAAEHFYAKVRL